MKLLNFLRVLDAIQSPGRSAAPPARNRKLELESLERRAVLTILDTILPAPEPLATPIVEVVQLPVPAPMISEDVPSPEYGGSGSGSGEPEPGEPATDQTPDPPTSEGGSAGGSASGSGDCPPETFSSDGGSGGGSGDSSPESTAEGSSGGSEGGSGSGSGDPDPPSSQGGTGSGSGGGTSDPPPAVSGSGSGTGGGGEAPTITSLQANRIGWLVWFVGSVSDTDGPVGGMTVFFIVGNNTSHSFTATVGSDGTFSTMGISLSAGTEIQAYTIDAQGNQSPLVFCLAY